MKNVSDKCVEKIKIHILYSITYFFRKPYRFLDNIEEHYRAGKATDENMAYSHWMLGTLGYKYTLRICNSYFLFTATMVARTRLIVTLYVHCFGAYIRVIREFWNSHRVCFFQAFSLTKLL
jgi:hypothetical protein